MIHANRAGCFAALLVAGTLPVAAGGQPWQRLPDMPLAVFNARATRSGRFAVITGGLTQLGMASNVVQLFDLDTDRWTRLLHLRTSRHSHAQVTLANGQILLAGGQTGSISAGFQAIASCELIDLKNQSVRQLPHLPRPAAHPTAHLLPGNRVLVIGGPTASVLDVAANKWIRHITLRRSRKGHASVLLSDGKVLVIAGEGSASLELVDPQRGVSRLLAVRLPMAMDDHRAALTADGRVWITGGQDSVSGDTTDKTWFVKIDGDGRSSIGDGPRLGVADGVADHCLARVGPWLVVAGGESQRQGRDTELRLARRWDSRGPAVIRLSSMQTPHDDAVSVVDGGRVIVFGGYAVEAVGDGAWRLPRVIAAVEQLRVAPIDDDDR